VSLRRGRARAELMGDINVVSLIDVMMLLLVIFMITAPMMQGGIDLTLPSAESAPLEAKSTVIVSVTATRVYIDNNEALTDGEFKAAFKSIAGKRTKDGVYLRLDKNITAQRWLDVISIMRAAGVQNVGVVTEPIGDGRQ
jgi:biopolymer transport protein ExbD